MTDSIRNTFQTIQTVLDILRHVTHFDYLRARTGLFFEDLDEWLAERNLTLRQLIGRIFAAMVTAMALGGLIDLVGIVVGTYDDKHYFLARCIITVGTLVGFSGFLPPLLLLGMAKKLFDLVIQGGEAALEILSDEKASVPQRLRLQLESLRERQNISSMLLSIYAVFAAASLALLCWPNFYGLFGMIVAALAISCIIALRKVNGVKGHFVTKLMMSGGYAFIGGAIVYAILGFIVSPLLYSAWPKLAPSAVANRFVLVGAMIGAVITFIGMLATIRLKGEEEEKLNGDVGFKMPPVQVVGIDSKTRKPTAFALKNGPTGVILRSEKSGDSSAGSAHASAPGTAAETHTTHTSSSHATHSKSNFWKWAIRTATVATIVALLVFIGVIIAAAHPNLNFMRGSSIAAPAPMTQPGVLPENAAVQVPIVPPVDNVAFRVISLTPDSGEFQLDARVIWQELPLTVSDGDVIAWEAHGKTCVAEPNYGFSCAEPDGLHPPGLIPWAEKSLVRPEEYPVGHAFVHELLLQVDGSKFAAGNINTYTVPNGADNQKIHAMLNIRTDEAILARGGPIVTFKITRKK